jgi:hypothetical protein
MIVTKKMLLVLTLVGALVGAGVGSLITHSAASNTAPSTSYDNAKSANVAFPDATYSQAAYRTDGKTLDQIATENSSRFSTSQEQTAYRQGFDDALANCTAGVNTRAPATYSNSTSTYQAPVRRYSNGRRAYYDYGTAPRGRTFWQKHRDKLTLAIGTGGGALIGGLIGGKKGAGIGSLAGLGSSALYTYKLRKRSPRRY